MLHCNLVFRAEDIWFLLDKDNLEKRKLYLATCPICSKKIALYSYFDKEKNEFIDKYYYSGGVEKIKKILKEDKISTLLGFKNKYKAPSGFKYGENKEIKRNGKIVCIKQYACDFWGNKILVKKIEHG